MGIFLEIFFIICDYWGMELWVKEYVFLLLLFIVKVKRKYNGFREIFVCILLVFVGKGKWDVFDYFFY